MTGPDTREHADGQSPTCRAEDGREAHATPAMVRAEAMEADELLAPPRILIVAPGRAERERLRARLAGLTGDVVLAESAAEGARMLGSGPFDLALVRNALPDRSGLEWTRAATERRPGLPVILLFESPSLGDAVAAMRSGAADVLFAGAEAHELIARVRAAADRARTARARERRIDRLKHTCRQLNNARQQVTKQVGSLCNDLVHAYQELADQMSTVALASEFASLIRSELDVESLLRCALEYLLAKAGPTNAAVFLPSSTGDYSLGAYVNYSCPKESVDVLLDHLANVIPGRVEDEEEILAFPGAAEFARFLGDDAHWLPESCGLAFACRHEGECLAVVLLFRDQAQPLDEALEPMLRTIADLFAHQLARVIHIHHRHLPRDQWGSFGDMDGGEDDLDMAA